MMAFEYLVIVTTNKPIVMSAAVGLILAEIWRSIIIKRCDIVLVKRRHADALSQQLSWIFRKVASWRAVRQGPRHFLRRSWQKP
jgi:hypothetical protein